MTDLLQNEELLRRLQGFGFSKDTKGHGVTTEQEFLDNLTKLEEGDPKLIQPQIQELRIDRRITRTEGDNHRYKITMMFLVENIEKGFNLRYIPHNVHSMNGTEIFEVNMIYDHSHFFAHRKGQYILLYYYTIDFRPNYIKDNYRQTDIKQGFHTNQLNEDFYFLPNTMPYTREELSRRSNYSSKAFGRFRDDYYKTYTLDEALAIYDCKTENKVIMLGRIYNHKSEHDFTEVGGIRFCHNLQSYINNRDSHPQRHYGGICTGGNNTVMSQMLYDNDVTGIARERVVSLQQTQISDNRATIYAWNRAWYNPILLFKQNYIELFSDIRKTLKTKQLDGKTPKADQKIILKMLDHTQYHHYDKDCYCVDCFQVKCAYVQGFRYNKLMLDSGNVVVPFKEFKYIVELYLKDSSFYYPNDYDSYSNTINSNFNNVTNLINIDSVEKTGGTLFSDAKINTLSAVKYYTIEYRKMSTQRNNIMTIEKPLLCSLYTITSERRPYNGFILYDQNINEWVVTTNEMIDYITNLNQSIKVTKSIGISDINNRYDKKNLKKLNEMYGKLTQYNVKNSREYIDDLSNYECY